MSSPNRMTMLGFLLAMRSPPAMAREDPRRPSRMRRASRPARVAAPNARRDEARAALLRLGRRASALLGLGGALLLDVLRRHRVLDGDLVAHLHLGRLGLLVARDLPLLLPLLHGDRRVGDFQD